MPLQPAAPTVIVVEHTETQPFAPVTFTLYDPEAVTVAVAVVCTGDVLHAYVYGAWPPVAVTLTVPLLLFAEQLTFGVGSTVTVVLALVVLHAPLAITTEYAPAPVAI